MTIERSVGRYLHALGLLTVIDGEVNASVAWQWEHTKAVGT